MHVSDHQPVRERHRCGIDLRTTADDEFPLMLCQAKSLWNG